MNITRDELLARRSPYRSSFRMLALAIFRKRVIARNRFPRKSLRLDVAEKGTAPRSSKLKSLPTDVAIDRSMARVIIGHDLAEDTMERFSHGKRSQPSISSASVPLASFCTTWTPAFSWRSSPRLAKCKRLVIFCARDTANTFRSRLRQLRLAFLDNWTLDVRHAGRLGRINSTEVTAERFLLVDVSNGIGDDDRQREL